MIIKIVKIFLQKSFTYFLNHKLCTYYPIIGHAKS